MRELAKIRKNVDHSLRSIPLVQAAITGTIKPAVYQTALSEQLRLLSGQL
jgi:hypothetical protein